ncbi:hypothetical protein ABPG75_006089 [Micractinium tetrahymenae]
MTPASRAACAALLLALLLGPGTAAGAYKPRVRKELRTLTDEEYRAFVVGLSVMLSLSTESGRRLFGPKFISYQECIVKHSVATNDPRGDQGHNGPPFMTFHRAFLLEMEQSLLAVAPALKALPYWDITLDNPGGKYYGTPKAIFGNKYLGGSDGDARVDYGVTTGVFAWRQVGKFIPAQWPQYKKWYNGSSAGFMRGPTSQNTNPLVTRFPTKNLANALKHANDPNNTNALLKDLPDVVAKGEFLVNQGGKYVMRYPAAEYQRCLDPMKYRTWMEWSMCIDITVVMPAPKSVDKNKYIGPQAGTTAMLHAGKHMTTGSLAAAPSKAIGDMFDVSTSPNEVLLFPIHHANLDRSAMMWQAAASKADPAMPFKYWGYPASKADWSTASSGTLLNDVLCSNAPFKSLFSSPPANPAGYTHRELLFHTRPGASPYTYDSML